ncbi:right-handed parallel beta-helix repeat-containing protein [Marilutibacter alkalisoli]|nr:right-handed parallel beta-helix repeat-containing protein [Lysobacter alkalisoli]
MKRLVTITLVVASLWAANPVQAAESYDNCTGFIDSLPATIGTQGTWCLRKNLSTGMASGHAIEITTNNVTIDCNDFKIGGLAAGPSSATNGIRAFTRQNITVRNCSIRGFYRGILLSGTNSSGHLIENNRLDNNLQTAIEVAGENSLIQNNQVIDTGGNPDTVPWGIYSDGADVLNNSISGVFAVVDNEDVYGIQSFGTGITISGNRVRGLVPTGTTGQARGISSGAEAARISDNHAVVSPSATGVGIAGGSGSFCTGNTVAGFSTAFQNCDAADGSNLSN